MHSYIASCDGGSNGVAIYSYRFTPIKQIAIASNNIAIAVHMYTEVMLACNQNLIAIGTQLDMYAWTKSCKGLWPIS